MIWLFLPTWNVPLKVYLFDSFERCVSSPRPVMYSYLSFRRQLVKNHAFCFHERTAEVAVEVDLLLRGVAPADRLARALEAQADAREHAVFVGRVEGAQVVGNVVGHLAFADVVAVPGAGEAIAARLDADAEHRAAGERAGVRAGAADLELFEAAEVEVAGVGGGAFGGVDAFDARLVLRVEAVRAEAGLVTGVRAADVERGHLDAGRLRHGRPDVAGVRDFGQQFLREVGAHRGRRGVDDRRGAGHGDGFLQRRDLHLHVDGERLVDDDAHVLPLDRVETGQLEVDRVDARRQRQEAEAAVAAGDLHLRLNQRRAGSRHGHARQHGAGVVGDGSVDTAAEFLCERGRCDRQQRDAQAEHGQPVQPHYSSSNQLKRVNANEVQRIRTHPERGENAHTYRTDGRSAGVGMQATCWSV